jgi:diguanylate cyclase (GGDEF)-like protein
MGSLINLPDKPMTLGRAEVCDVRLEDQHISRRHLTIKPRHGGHVVIDLESTNGTFVNDQGITKAKLKNGDMVRAGIHIFRYLSGESVETDYHKEIYRLTISDPLTGVYNKRYFLEYLERELARSIRYQRPLALILLDLDRFKAINDQLGHLAGDDTLREVAARLKDKTRQEELLARYGGEEFAVVLPETNLEGAVLIGERLRRLVGEQPFCFGGQKHHVTVSLGVAVMDGTVPLSVEDLIREADARLYEAKAAGRNCLRA